jgi:hypothetical protein
MSNCQEFSLYWILILHLGEMLKTLIEAEGQVSLFVRCLFGLSISSNIGWRKELAYDLSVKRLGLRANQI